jgi:hypothetical protein
VRVKASITLPKELLGRLDRVDKNRPALLERAALAYLAQLERQIRDQKDIEIINRHAERLNREAADTLAYPVGARISRARTVKRSKESQRFFSSVQRAMPAFARRVRRTARIYGTPLYVWENGKIVAKKP